MNLKFEGNQVTSFFKLNQQYFFTVHQQAFATGLCVKSTIFVPQMVVYRRYSTNSLWKELNFKTN